MIFDTKDDKEELSLLYHQAAVGRHWRSIHAMKEYMAWVEPDVYAIAEIWDEIPQEDQILLWRAPSKGGCFTTWEREFLRMHLSRKNS